MQGVGSLLLMAWSSMWTAKHFSGPATALPPQALPPPPCAPPMRRGKESWGPRGVLWEDQCHTGERAVGNLQRNVTGRLLKFLVFVCGCGSKTGG